MANPTSNFGWQMPTPVDLVTDLPADFEVFGQAVDSSMADLLGGTTGQVLAKNSNTNMDFVWVTTDDANAIQNTIVDAKGDLIAASASDTPARLAVGTNFTILEAASGETTGLKWGGGSVSFTPTLTNITLGNGTNTASYVRVGNLVHLTGSIVFGSTTSIVAGSKISLPFNAKVTKQLTTTVHYNDTGTNNYIGYLYVDTASTARFFVVETGGAYSQFQGISGTIPFTWTTTDEIWYSISYEVA